MNNIENRFQSTRDIFSDKVNIGTDTTYLFQSSTETEKFSCIVTVDSIDTLHSLSQHCTIHLCILCSNEFIDFVNFVTVCLE